jgi:S1-C subfamily serine protease
MVINATSLRLFWVFVWGVGLIVGNCSVMAIAPEYPLTTIEREKLPLALENLEQRGRAVTVRVIASEKSSSGITVKNAGSGILISKQKTTYFIITNNHVLKASTNVQVVTPDDKSYTATLVNALNFPSIDLALLSFQSQVVYPTARLGRTRDLKIGDWVFATGFPRRSQSWKFAQGQYTLAAPKPMESGYAFGYSSEVEIGMSGGAVMDAYGRVIAVNGVHAKPLWGKPSYLYATGEKPCEPIREEMANLSWAIPMETVIQFMPDLRFASLETVQTKDNFPNPFSATYPSPEFWQWRASHLSKCAAVPLSQLVSLAWTNAALPHLTFSSLSLYPKIHLEDYMSEFDFLRFDRRSLVNSALTFSFTIASTVASTLAAPALLTNTPAIAQIPQPVIDNTENVLITQIPQSMRSNSEEDQRAKAQIYLSQGQTLFEQGQYDRAKIIVEQAIDLNLNNPLAWQLLGNCLKKMGRDQEALSAYNQAIKLLSVAKDTEITNANLNGASQVSAQSYGQSKNDIVQLWLERARTLDRLNRYQESVTSYDQALKLRCQEQLLRVNEPFPSVCQNYLLPETGSNIKSPVTAPNDVNQGSVTRPMSPSQQPTTPSKPNRSVW